MGQSVLVVDGRNASRTVTELGMRCDKKEIPDPAGGERPEGYWIAGMGGVTGTLPWLESSQPPLTSVVGDVCLAVTKTHVYAIVGDKSKPASPAAWIAAPLSGVKVAGSDYVGLFKKRPGLIEISGDGWDLNVGKVNRLFRSSNRFQTGQEGSLLSALGG